MRITILNQYCENRGDEAAGEALVKNLLENPFVERIDIIYNSAFKLNLDNSKVFHRNVDLLLKKIGIRGIIQYILFRRTPLQYFCYANNTMREMAYTIRNSDYIFVTPCGASIGIYKDWAFLLRLVFCIQEQKQPIFYLDTVGRSNDILFDSIATYIMRRSIMYVREKASCEYLKSIGISSEKGVDTAFSLNPLYNQQKDDRIGVVTTLLNWHPDFKNQDMKKKILDNIVPGIAMFCVVHNYNIDIIPHIGSQEELSFMSDFAEKLRECHMANESICILKDVKTSFQYDKAIASEKLMVGMRYHSIVLAAKNAVPFLSIAYENKMKEVCDYTDSINYCLDLHKEITPKQVSDLLEQINNDSERITSKLKNIYPKLQMYSKLPLKQIQG